MDLGYNFKKGIYLISPSKIEDLTQFRKDLQFILKKVKVSCFQLRLKNVSEDEVIEAINIIRPVCIKFNTNFILNDNVELAAKYACDGLHIGQFDGTLNDVRKKFQGIIGVSCYNSLERGLEMASMGANYVSFGAFYQSKTKPEAVKCEVSVLKEFTKKSKVHACVIGGINSANAKILVENGAYIVALSSAIWDLKKNIDRVTELEKILSYF